jgi:tetratricopeptide (TPR) repeat protein
MKHLQSQFLFFILFLFSTSLSAQSNTPTDTIEIARQLAYNKNYTKAVTLLETFELNHPKDINSVRLHAQILYWMNHFENAFQLCENALKNIPNQYIKLDYARMLFEQYQLQRAEEILIDYLKSDKSNVEANNMMGTISYWNGNPGLAKSYFKLVIKRYPKNEWALRYLNEINIHTAPYLKFISNYNDDTQPLQSINSVLESGWYSSNWLSPKVKFEFNHFIDTLKEHNTYSFQLGNKFSLSGIKTEFSIAGGVYKNQNDDTLNWIGEAELNKRLLKHFYVSLMAERKPYLYTLSSLQNTIMHNRYTVAFHYEKADSWNGMIAYNILEFPDNNSIQSFSSWLLTPPLKFLKLELSIGYANNFADSKINHFTSTKTISEIIANNNVIDGIYNPYFTPELLQIHSAIAQLAIIPSKSFSILLNGSFGVYAMAENPYLFLSSDENNQLIICKDYTPMKFNPFDITAKLLVKVSNLLIIESGYTYNKTLFYTNQNVNLTLKYIFAGERK